MPVLVFPGALPVESLPAHSGRASVPLKVDAPISFRSWASSAHLKFIKARTPFAYFLFKTLHLCRCGDDTPASVLFPLPVPFPGSFRSLPSLGSRKRTLVAERRLLHVLVMALNYLYNDCSFVPLGLLRREPNPSQRRCLRYLGKLVRTYGSEQEGVIPSSAGRRMNALHARLGELSEKLACLGPIADPYAWIPPEDRELPQDSPAEALCPYVPVAADRLQLSGKGSWDPTPYLSDDLWLAYVEPRSLLFGGAPPPGSFPDCTREDPAETLRLARLWSTLGLLRLEPPDSSLQPHHYTRIFCAKKSSGRLRQIGDRRGPNGLEARLPGPSRHLPTGEVMTSLSIAPSREGFALCVTDRTDFYRQLQATRQKASTNRLRPLIPAHEVSDLPAWWALLEEMGCKDQTDHPVAKGEAGDHPQGLEPPERESPVQAPTFVQACFSSILQGDHLGSSTPRVPTPVS